MNITISLAFLQLMENGQHGQLGMISHAPFHAVTKVLDTAPGHAQTPLPSIMVPTVVLLISLSSLIHVIPMTLVEVRKLCQVEATQCLLYT